MKMSKRFLLSAFGIIVVSFAALLALLLRKSPPIRAAPSGSSVTSSPSASLAPTLPASHTSVHAAEVSGAPQLPGVAPMAPSPIDYERKHRGFNKAFRAVVAENIDFRRAERRCLLKLPPDMKTIDFYTVQTYSKTDDRTATLTDVSFVSDAQNVEAFESCEKETLMSAHPTLALPDSDMGDQFQVRDEARLSLDRNPTPEDVEATLARLKKEIEESPDSPHSKLLQLKYDSYACYQAHHSMDECL